MTWTASWPSLTPSLTSSRSKCVVMGVGASVGLVMRRRNCFPSLPRCLFSHFHANTCMRHLTCLSIHPLLSSLNRHWPHFFLPHAKNGDPVYVEVSCWICALWVNLMVWNERRRPSAPTIPPHTYTHVHAPYLCSNSGRASSICRPCSQRASGSMSSCAFFVSPHACMWARGEHENMWHTSSGYKYIHTRVHTHPQQPPLLLVHRVPLHPHHEGRSVPASAGCLSRLCCDAIKPIQQTISNPHTPQDDSNKHKLITVYDLAGANFGDLKGEVRRCPGACKYMPVPTHIHMPPPPRTPTHHRAYAINATQ